MTDGEGPLLSASARWEAEIASQHRQGDIGAAAKLALEVYGDEIYRFVHSLSEASEDADEVFARFCERFWRGLPGFEWRSSLRTWLYVLARNEYRRYRADGFSRRACDLSQAPEWLQDAQRQRTETAPFRRTDVKDAFARLRDALNEEDRVILSLRLDHNMSWQEIAAILCDDSSKTAQTRMAARARKRFERIKQRLRKLAVEQGLLEAS